MDPWIAGLVAVLVIGVAVIMGGALVDRRRHQRAVTRVLSAPDRSIPGFRSDAPAPHYLSELQARRTDAHKDSDLDEAERSALTTRLSSPDTCRVDCGYLGESFVTDRKSSWAVLVEPAVLVCTDAVRSIRELLPALEKVMLSRTPLVVVVPDIVPDVLATLEVNQVRGLLRIVVVRVSASQGDVIARASGATALSRSDLQSGFVRPEHLGKVGTWVSDKTHSYLLPNPIRVRSRTRDEHPLGTAE